MLYDYKLMKKQIINLFLISISSFILLSGCTQQNNTRNPYTPTPTNKIELIDYTVVTMWWNKEGTQKYYESGFYHEIPEDASNYSISYIINGTIKNNIGTLVNVNIGIIFYDSNNNELYSASTDVFNLPNTYTNTFSVIDYNRLYFDKVDHVSFKFYVL